MKFLIPSAEPKTGSYTTFLEPVSGEHFAIDDYILMELPKKPEEVMEGVVLWDDKICVPVLRCEDGTFHCGAIVSASFEGKRVRVTIDVLEGPDTDPAPANPAVSEG